jgi:monovalent cation:H+ antiporter, CPA1 family
MSARSAAGTKAGGETKTAAMHPGWLHVLERVPLFSALSPRHLKRVGKLAEGKRFAKGATIVKAGTRGDAFYVILDGGAKVEMSSGRTRKLGEGDFFGELALLDGAPRAATVTATDTLTTARIGRAAFQKLLKDEPTIGLGLAYGLLTIVRAQEKD